MTKRIDWNYIVEDVSMLAASTVFGIIFTPWVKQVLSQGEVKEDPNYVWAWVIVMVCLLILHIAVKAGALSFGSGSRRGRRG